MHIEKLAKLFMNLESPVRDRMTNFNKHLESVSQPDKASVDLTNLYTAIEKRMRNLGCQERFSLSIMFSFVLAAINLRMDIKEIERQVSEMPDAVITRIGDVKNRDFCELVFPNIKDPVENSDELANFIWAYVIHISDIATLSELVSGFYSTGKNYPGLTEIKFIKTAERYVNEFRDHPVEWIMEIA